MPAWRDAEAYRPLIALDRSGWAWEWLRRDPAYRRAARQGLDSSPGPDDRQANARAWGLHRFEDPALSAERARPIWTRQVSRFVLEAIARPGDGEGFDLAVIARRSTSVPGVGRLVHHLISNGHTSLRIDLVGSALTAAPVGLSFEVAGSAQLRAHIAMLEQLDGLSRSGRLIQAAPVSAARGARLARMLRVRDALAQDAPQRLIAEHLFDASVADPHWRIERPTVRSQVQRLVRNAKAMAAGGYWTLLSEKE
ncbi:MAG: DUF2285 domain-containing protein [Pseudomonadota bacterium]